MPQKFKPIFQKDRHGKEQRVEGFFADDTTSVIYFKKSIDGRVVKFSCRTKNLIQAKRFANKEIKSRLKSPTKNLAFTIATENTKWLEHRKREHDMGEIGASAYRNSVNASKRYMQFWGETYVHDITQESVQAFEDWFYKTFPDEQMENTAKYFRMFCRHLAKPFGKGRPKLSYVPTIRDPRRRTHKVARKKKKERTFTQKEFKKIMEAVDRRYSDNEYMVNSVKLLMLFMYTMAFRVESDGLSARWEQFDLDHEVPLFRFTEGTNKANLSGRQGVHSQVLPFLRKQQELAKGSPWVFPQKKTISKHMRSQYIDWDGLREKADIGWHWTAHTFRHTCLTALFNDERIPDSLIIKCYRISLAEALETYIHVTDSSLAKMRDAMEVQL